MRHRVARRTGRLAALALGLALALGGAATDGGAQEQPRRGGTLTVITPSDVSTFDPHPAVGFSVRVFANIYEPLFRKDEKGVLHGHLAESWKMVNPTTLQVTLRKGVKFHSGNELTAEDVKFTYERQLNPADLARDAAVIKMIKTPIRVVDRYTLVIETREPNAALVDTLAQSLATLIPDSAEVKKWGKDYGLHPSGTGPFKFVEWVRGQHVKLARNPDYWNGPPHLDFLVFKVVPEEATRVLALESGEADVLFETPPSAIAPLKANAKVRVHKVSTYRDVNLHFNAKKPPTDDVRLRRALAQAIDVKTIVEQVVTPDIGQVATGLFNPSVFGACDVGFPVYDPAKAKQGFAELGYRPGRDGRLEKDGRPLTLTLVVNPQRDPRNGEVAEAIQAQLRAAGVDLQVRANEFATYMRILQSAEGDYNLIFHGYGVATADADLKATFFLSANMPPAGQNSARFASPELDGVILAAQKESSRDKRRELYCQFGRIYRDQGLGVPLYASFRTTSMLSHVNGMVLHPDEWYTQAYTRVWLGPKP
jgi:peptide/nickel transport system substrate-binding protein